MSVSIWAGGAMREEASAEAVVGVEGFAVTDDRVLSVLALVTELMRKAASFSAIVTQAVLADSSRPLPCVRTGCGSRRGAFTSCLTSLQAEGFAARLRELEMRRAVMRICVACVCICCRAKESNVVRWGCDEGLKEPRSGIIQILTVWSQAKAGDCSSPRARLAGLNKFAA